MSETLRFEVEGGFDRAGGTSLLGYLDVTYADLVRTFGEPPSKGDGYKVDAEWVIWFPEHEVVATVYNYKDGVNYLGESEGTPVEEITDWHVGGHVTAAMALVQFAIDVAPKGAVEA